MKVSSKIVITGTDEQIGQLCEIYNIDRQPLSDESIELLQKIEAQNEFEAEITIKVAVPASKILRR